MESQPRTRSRLIRLLVRFARGGALLAVLLLAAIPGWVLLSRGDAVNSMDGDLLVEAVDCRGGGAAHRTWALLGSEFADFDHSRAQKALVAFREGDFSDEVWIDEQADRFSEVHGLLLGGTRPDSMPQSREIDLADEIVDDGIMGLHALARISSATALLLSHDGRVDEAIENALYGLRAGHTIASHRDIDLLGLMIAGAVQSISLATLEQVVRDHPLTPETARRLTGEIAQRQPTRANWQQMWANEYRWVRGVFSKSFETESNPDAVVDLAEAASAWFLVRLLPDDYLIQPNRTFVGMSNLYRARRDQTGRDCLTVYARQPHKTTAMDRLSLLVRPNPVGEYFVLISQPDFERFELKRCGFEKNFALAQVVVASKAYSDHEGRLPESIDALVPRFLAAVPTNPYDGGSLRYSKSDRTVSVDSSEIVAVLGPDRVAALEGQSLERKL